MDSKIRFITLAAVMAFALGGCAASGPVDVTDNPVGDKQGKACVKNILGFIATGDASISAAKKNGGISKVATVDVVGKSGFFVGKYCTYVTGQ